MQDYLFHYTNVESLALIMQSRSIRFSSLDKMDDLQEKEALDSKNAGQYVLVSSWTDDSEESIPMWSMYASINAGVRIKLKITPFAKKKNRAEDIKKAYRIPMAVDGTGEMPESYITYAEMLENGFIWPKFLSKDSFLFKMNYTDEEALLYPRVINRTKDAVHFDVGQLGKNKNTSWKFQNEWRYIINIFPLDLNQDLDMILKQTQDFQDLILSDKKIYELPSYYDMRLDDNAFTNMEIMLSPGMSEGNRIIVGSLVQRYNPNARVVESSLHNLL